MASFTVRPFLKGSPSILTYQALAARMATFGATDVVRSDEGHWYKLMPGEYDVTRDLTAEQVRQLTIDAITAVHPSGGAALVAEYVKLCWEGLERVPAPASAGIAALLNLGLRAK